MKRRFASARGRPPARKSQHNGSDLGTPELIMKRAANITAEPIDLCLTRGIISSDEHRSALHLRWLHTIRYGAPGVTALDLTRGVGSELHPEDEPAWRSHREKDYQEAIDLLEKRRYSRDVIPCVIYNEPPSFLSKARLNAAFNHPAIAQQNTEGCARLSDGLALLTALWSKQQPAK